MTRYILPLVTAVLILIFYLGLPDLNRFGSLKKSSSLRWKFLTRFDFFIMICLTFVSGIVNFSYLGDRSAPQSFHQVSSLPATVVLQQESVVSEIAFYTGVGIGDYTIEASVDGILWQNIGSFSQSAGEVLKWHSFYPEMHTACKYIRLSSWGNTWLGEAVIFDDAGRIIPVKCDYPVLCDEQALVQHQQTFMNSTYFDEIYHARTAWEHLNDVYPYEVSHPPLGKLIISLGILLFGMTPFGWRFSGTLFGVMMVPVMYVFIKKLFGSTLAAAGGALVFASDFMHFVQTRLATIDTYAVFFILLMYLFMYIYVTEDRLFALALSGIFFGLGAASKWTCLYAGAGLGVIWALYRIDQRKKGLAAFIKNALFCCVFFVVLPCCIYYVSYIPYGRASGVYNIFSREYINIVLSNQQYMFNYHSMLVAEHPYSSKWYQWVLNIRPILYYLAYNPDGTRSSFGAFLNPMLCWGGLLAMFVLMYRAGFRRDREALFIIIAYLAQLIPWMFITRLTFEYHYFPCSVFLILAIAYVFRIMELGTPYHLVYIFSFSTISVLLFILFYPALSGMPINNTTGSLLLGWLPTWPF